MPRALDQKRGCREWIEMRHLHLFVEITSPSTAWHARFTKRTLYREKRVMKAAISSSHSA